MGKRSKRFNLPKLEWKLTGYTGICPQCHKEGIRTVTDFITSGEYPWGGAPTEDFVDEEGKQHSHRLDKSRYHYKCDRGHEYESLGHPGGCPSCDYGDDIPEEHISPVMIHRHW